MTVHRDNPYAVNYRFQVFNNINLTISPWINNQDAIFLIKFK